MVHQRTLPTFSHQLLKVILLFVLLLCLSRQQASTIIEYRRITLGISSVPLRTHTVTYLNAGNYSAARIGVALSLTSINTGNQIGVYLLNKTNTHFVVQATSAIHAFSYIAVYINGDDMQTGQLTTMYMQAGIVSSASQYSNQTVPLSYLNFSDTLIKFGVVEPFISYIGVSRNQHIPRTYLSVYSSINTVVPNNTSIQCIRIIRTVDITKIKISYIAYLPLSPIRMVIRPPNAGERFSIGRSMQPIFTSINTLEIYGQPSYFLFTSALLANIKNMNLIPNIVTNETATCYNSSNYIDGLNNKPNMTICLPYCSQRTISLNGYRVCINNTMIYNTSSQYNYAQNYALIPFKTTQVCRSYSPSFDTLINNGQNLIDSTFYPYQSIYSTTQLVNFWLLPTFLTCSDCNSDNNLVQYYDGSCFCGSSFYAMYQAYPQNQQCYTCNQYYKTCPFIIQLQIEVVPISDNSSQYMNIHVNINNNMSYISPYNTFYTYQQLPFTISINNIQIQPSQTTWSSPTQVVYKLTQFAYSKKYSVKYSILNSIILNNNNTYIFSTPSTVVKQAEYQHTQSAKIVADSIQAVTNAAPLASLVSLVLGSKINLFSFMQVSSIFYMSSYIRWSGYGSILRMDLTQTMFKLTPTNFFTTVKAQLPIYALFSNSSVNPNSNNSINAINSLDVYHINEGELYITYSIQFIISLIIQIIVIEIIFRLLTLIFQLNIGFNQGYQINPKGLIMWKKKHSITQYIELNQLNFKQKVCLLLSKLQMKRKIFYTTMFNAQLPFHSFMIFSQFNLIPQSYTDIYNLSYCLLLLSIIIVIPCFGPHSPMVLFKSVSIVYKKREYYVGQLFIYYILGVVQLLLYGVCVARFSQPIWQCAPVSLIILMKIVVMFSYIKLIQFVKCASMLLFFIILGIGQYLQVGIKQKLQYATVGLMMGVCFVQIVKIIRSFIIIVITFLRDNPSIIGKAVVKKVEEHVKRDEETHQLRQHHQ